MTRSTWVRIPYVQPFTGSSFSGKTRGFESRFGRSIRPLPTTHRVRLMAGQSALTRSASVRFVHPVPFALIDQLDRSDRYERSNSGSNPDRRTIHGPSSNWKGRRCPKPEIRVRIPMDRPRAQGRLERHSTVYGAKASSILVAPAILRLSSSDRKAVSLTASAGLIPASLTRVLGMSSSGRRRGFQSHNAGSIPAIPTMFGSET